MKFILSETDLTQWEKKLQAGSYAGVFIRIAGTNIAAQTMAVGDIGNFTLAINGEQFFFASSGFIADMNNQWYGYAEAASAVGAAFSFGLFLPLSIPGFPNALNVDSADDFYLSLQPAAAVATKVLSWTITVSKVSSGNVENYLPKFFPANESPGAAATIKNRIQNENIFTIWVNGSNITRIHVERDGVLEHEADYNSLISETSMRRRVEVALISYAELPLGDQVADLLSDAVDLQVITSAADSVLVQYLAVAFNQRRRSNSIDTRRNEVNKRITAIEKTRPLDIGVARAIEPSAGIS